MILKVLVRYQPTWCGTGQGPKILEDKMKKKLVIDRAIWLHGGKKNSDITKANGASYLLRPADNKMCCLGIYLHACGVTKERLNGVISPIGVLSHSMFKETKDIPRQARWLTTKNYPYSDSPTVDATELMNINDKSADEWKITKIFGSHDVDVTFKGKREGD